MSEPALNPSDIYKISKTCPRCENVVPVDSDLDYFYCGYCGYEQEADTGADEAYQRMKDEPHEN